MLTQQIEKEKQLAALEAVKFISDGMVVGLGTGSTASYAIEAIGSLVKKGMKITGVASSNKTSQLATGLKIPLVDISAVQHIDITIDGADEFTPKLALIKGGGGALFREKVVASISRKMIIVADSTKLVSQLGKFRVPIEVVPFAANYVHSHIKKIQGNGIIRKLANKEFITDQRNYIMDTDFGLIGDPARLAAKIDAISGVLEHGLFISLAHEVIMGKGNSTIIFT